MTCPRCNRSDSPIFLDGICLRCETEFMREWPPAGVADEAKAVGVELDRYPSGMTRWSVR